MPKRLRAGVVYVIKSESGLYKIGRACDLERRLREYRTILPVSFTLVLSIATPEASLLEMALHRQFSDKRLHGEWFELDTEDVEWLRSHAAEIKIEPPPEPIVTPPIEVEGERMYTVAEVAERLRLHQQTVRDWLRSGKLKGIRLGGTKAGWRIPDSEVARLLRGEQ